MVVFSWRSSTAENRIYADKGHEQQSCALIV
jgi:hypothetical protein